MATNSMKFAEKGRSRISERPTKISSVVYALQKYYTSRSASR